MASPVKRTPKTAKVKKCGRPKQPVYKATSAIVRSVKIRPQEWDGGKVIIEVTFKDNDRDCLASFRIPDTSPQAWWHISTTMARVKNDKIPKEQREIIKQRNKILHDIGIYNAFRLAFPKFTYRTTNTLRTLSGYNLEKYNELRKKRWTKLLKELCEKYNLFKSEKEREIAINSIDQHHRRVILPEYIKNQIESCRHKKMEN